MQTAKTFLRSAKNFTFGYTDMQIKTREATSNDPCGPSTHSLNEIASATFNEEVMSIIRRRLNDHGKNWRHVYKFGSERVIEFALGNVQLIKTLKEFQYVDNEGRDHGASVRQKSRELTALLLDMDQLNVHREAGRRGDRERNGILGTRQSMLSLRSGKTFGVNGGFSEEEALKIAIEESHQHSRIGLEARGKSTEALYNGNVQKDTQKALTSSAPLIDLMGDDDFSIQTDNPSLSYSAQLMSQFNQPASTFHFNQTDFTNIPYSLPQQPNQTSANSTPFSFPNNSNNLYSLPSCNSSGIFQPSFSQTNPFLAFNSLSSPNSSSFAKELVDLRPQSLLANPFSSNNSQHLTQENTTQIQQTPSFTPKNTSLTHQNSFDCSSVFPNNYNMPASFFQQNLSDSVPSSSKQFSYNINNVPFNCVTQFSTEATDPFAGNEENVSFEAKKTVSQTFTNPPSMNFFSTQLEQTKRDGSCFK